jgi:hypothetical protein
MWLLQSIDFVEDGFQGTSRHAGATGARSQIKRVAAARGTAADRRQA